MANRLDEGLGARLWSRDPTLWTEDAAQAEVVKNRLGWLDIVEPTRLRAQKLVAFASGVLAGGFDRVLLLGMGGSSLCPEVLAATLGVGPGGLPLRVLDSTVPATVREAERWAAAGKALFVVSSKSGTTIEVVSLYRYFAERAAPDAFVAITDHRTPLDKLAREKGFRRAFVNPSDIGGRYSALSYFGMVPAALLGLDVARFLDRAQSMVEACGEGVRDDRNPGVELGRFLGGAARSGRDKLTLLLAAPIASFGSWIEQLVAESTGKQGKGIVPIDREPSPAAYGADRVFVRVNLRSQPAPSAPEGAPVYEIDLDDAGDLGAEFFRWEFATAIASAVLGVNAFDEPNVAEAKQRTTELLDQYVAKGGLPAAPSGDAAALVRHLAGARPGDYVALMAYLHRTDAIDRELTRLRAAVGRRTGCPTTLGWGPRFLHSTGQLHKGGGDRGLFVQLTADDEEPLPIPSERWTFSVLRQAQALGDLQALGDRGRRVLRIHLGSDPAGALGTLGTALIG